MSRIEYKDWAVTATGDVVGGSAVEVRVQSTGALADLYDAATAGSLLSNPLNAEADGSFVFFVEPGKYDVTVGSGASESTKPLYALRSDITYPTIAAMALAETADVGDVVSVDDGANGEREEYEATAGGLTADGALVVDGVGVQWVSKRTVYADWSEFIGDRRTFTAGTTLTIPSIGAVYQATDSTGNLGQTNAGGQEFDVLRGDIRAWGAVGDYNGVTGTDNTSAIQYALDSGIGFVRAPAGNYLVSDTLLATEVFFDGAGPENTTLSYTGTGFCIELASSEQHGGVSKLRLESKASNQSGMLVGGTMSNVRNMYINNFDQYTLRLGDGTNGKGSYWGNFSELRLRVDTDVNALAGLYIDSVTPASNDNRFENVCISGNFVKPLYLGGNGNTFDNGTIEMTRGDENVVAMIDVDGTSNRLEGVYVEPIVDPAPQIICRFGSNSSSNVISILPQFPWTSNAYSSVTDAGVHNEFYAARRSPSVEIAAKPVANQTNLIPNSDFKVWRDANNPTGWLSGSARISKETGAANIRGSSVSLKMAESGTNSTISQYLNDYFGSTSKANPYPLDFLRGQSVVAGAWVKTTVSGAGGVRFTWNSATGNPLHLGPTSSGHTGGGGWELITASGRVPDDATRVALELRSHPLNTAITGDVYFSQPFLVFGTRVVVPEPRFITDSGGKVHGDLEIMEDSLSDTNSGFLILNGRYLWADTTGALRISGTRPTNLDTGGVVVGTQS